MESRQDVASVLIVSSQGTHCQVAWAGDERLRTQESVVPDSGQLANRLREVHLDGRGLAVSARYRAPRALRMETYLEGGWLQVVTWPAYPRSAAAISPLIVDEAQPRGTPEQFSRAGEDAPLRPKRSFSLRHTGTHWSQNPLSLLNLLRRPPLPRPRVFGRHSGAKPLHHCSHSLCPQGQASPPATPGSWDASKKPPRLKKQRPPPLGCLGR